MDADYGQQLFIRSQRLCYVFSFLKKIIYNGPDNARNKYNNKPCCFFIVIVEISFSAVDEHPEPEEYGDKGYADQKSVDKNGHVMRTDN